MTQFALLFTLAGIGISETTYLIKKRIALEKPVCIIGESCALVLKSKYSKIFGIHNDVLGFGFYIFISFVSAFLVIGTGHMTLLYVIFKLSITIGALLSLFLTYLQWRVIRAWCFWCLMSAVTIWLMFIIILANNLA